MLSRIADSLFWMNRYMERSGCLLRLARTHYILCMDKGQWGSYLAACPGTLFFHAR
jgi:uncharacterized alpha-E superfamily protein